MRRQVCWVEKLEDGVRREVRVTFPGRGRILWQFKRTDTEAWDYATPPTEDDWQTLEEKVRNRYQRRSARIEDLTLVQNRGRE